MSTKVHLVKTMEKEMATHSNVLAWKISWMEEPSGLYSSWGHKELDITEWLTLSCMDVRESWAPKIDAFELCCWRKLLRVPWTARRSNQSILKEISPEYSLEGLMLKLKFQYFDHLMWSTDPLEKTLMLGKIEGGRRRGRQRMRWLYGITDSMDMSLSKLQSWWWTRKHSVLGSQRVGHDWVTELNWRFNIPSHLMPSKSPIHIPHQKFVGNFLFFIFYWLLNIKYTLSSKVSKSRA